MQTWLSQISWDQLVYWSQYAAAEPWGEERADLRAGIIASVIANANRDPKLKPTPFKADDFMPYTRRSQPVDRRPITSAEQWRAFKGRMKLGVGRKVSSTASSVPASSGGVL